jgi:exosortase A-associated hydrolase 2
MEALFIAGPAGPLFSVYHAASAPRGDPLGLVYLPPFAEEMNRARRMAALQARRLSELGIHVLLLDPFGTGDSAGDFGDARWEIWREDVQRAVDWIGPRCDGRVGLWGLRLGALLAADVAAAGIQPFSRLLLWQPLLSGERFLTQFLRLRMAAGLAQETGQESTKDLRARLARGERLEVGGYELSPALAEAIVSLKLANLLTSLPGLPSDWLEVGASGAAELPPGSRQVVETLRDQGCDLRARAVEGAAFWSIQEFTLAPALLDATDELFHR